MTYLCGLIMLCVCKNNLKLMCGFNLEKNARFDLLNFQHSHLTYHFHHPFGVHRFLYESLVEL